MDNVIIEQGAQVSYSLISSGSVVKAGAVVNGGCVLGQGYVRRKTMRIVMYYLLYTYCHVLPHLMVYSSILRFLVSFSCFLDECAFHPPQNTRTGRWWRRDT